jgi:hypothetical protein
MLWRVTCAVQKRRGQPSLQLLPIELASSNQERLLPLAFALEYSFP